MTNIQIINQNGDIQEVASYSLGTKESLLAFYQQHFKKDWNTSRYPKALDIIKETKSKRGHYMTVNGVDYIAH